MFAVKNPPIAYLYLLLLLKKLFNKFIVDVDWFSQSMMTASSGPNAGLVAVPRADLAAFLQQQQSSLVADGAVSPREQYVTVQTRATPNHCAPPNATILSIPDYGLGTDYGENIAKD